MPLDEPVGNGASSDQSSSLRAYAPAYEFRFGCGCSLPAALLVGNHRIHPPID